MDVSNFASRFGLLIANTHGGAELERLPRAVSDINAVN